MKAQGKIKFKMGLVVALCLLSVGKARSEERGSDYSKFAGLYDRQKTLQETIDRLNKMEDLRKTAQNSLERLLKVKPGNIELELRYGELIVSRGRDLEQFANEVSAAGDEKKGRELSVTSKNLLRTGLNLHTKILAHAKNHPMAPRIYLGMARTQYSLGQKPAALNSADLGIRSINAANTKTLGDTELQLWMLRGDAAFDQSKAGIAHESYERALKKVNEGSIEEAYVQYKLAWVEYNMKDSESALKHLDRLFEVTRDRYALKNEAVLDYALFVADLSHTKIEARGGIKGIYQYLSKQGEDTAAVKAMERLATTFAKNGRRVEGIAVHEFLISESNFDPLNVDRALTVVEWTHSVADKHQLTEKYFWLISNFGPKSAWYAAQANRLQVQRNAVDKIEASVRKYALHLHLEAQKETNSELRDKREVVVAHLYDAHIENFNRNVDVPKPETARIFYYRAEIHRRIKQYADAGRRYDQYLRSLDVMPKEQLDKSDLKLKDEAIWGSVQVWAKAIEADPKLVPNMLGAADRFLKEKGSDPKAAQVLLDASLVEEKAGNRVVAAKRLEELISKYPRTTQTVAAVHASLDILNKENDWINLAQRARMFLNTMDKWAPASEKTKMHADLTKILSQTEAKACDALQQQPDRLLEAALCFERFAKGFEKDAQAPKALLIAADIYDKLKDASSALGALEVLVKKYPDSDHAQNGFSRLAKAYEKAFEFEKAVSIYETLLSRTKEVKDREALLQRLLVLLNGLGETNKLAAWLNRKDTPESIRAEYDQRRAVQNLITLRYEERAYGYTDDGKLASTSAQKIYTGLVARANAGKANLEEMLEIHRLKGVFHRLAGRLDKADEEWMAGLKKFWRSKEHTPAIWEAAARLRLEQGSVWETVFQNTDFIKNPSRKAELYQKLEGWYAEVVEMKAPVVALSALWKSAELNSRFADEVRSAPVPAELLQPGAEKQLALYKQMLLEKTEPMKKKAIAISEKIAEKAREWKVISPDVLASLKIVSTLRSGVELPGQLVRVQETQVLKFPWSELPRWVDLSKEQEAWDEWNLTSKDLKNGLASQKRVDARRAAFVTLLRDGSLANEDVKKWSSTFVDRAGVQLRIQAMIKDGDLNRAGLFLDQYESFFGSDAFTEHHYGRLEWAKGNYSLAYLKWVRPTVAQSSQDFRSMYWSEGWNSLLASLSNGAASTSRKVEVYERLNGLAKATYEKQLLAKLCLDKQATCRDAYSAQKLGEIVGAAPERHLAHKFDDHRSAFDVQKLIVSSYIYSVLGSGVNSYPQIEPLRKALSGLYALTKQTDNPNEDVFSDYWSLRKTVDEMQDKLDAAAKNRVLAGAAN